MGLEVSRFSVGARGFREFLLELLFEVFDLSVEGVDLCVHLLHEVGLVESGVFFEVFSVCGEDEAFDAVVVHGGFLGALFAFGHALFELDLVEDFLVACDDSDLGETLIAFSLVVEIR